MTNQIIQLYFLLISIFIYLSYIYFRLTDTHSLAESYKVALIPSRARNIGAQHLDLLDVRLTYA